MHVRSVAAWWLAAWTAWAAADQPGASPRPAEDSLEQPRTVVVSGLLRSVPDARAGEPAFALQDRNDELWTAAADPPLDLRSFVGKQVRLTGVGRFRADTGLLHIEVVKVQLATDDPNNAPAETPRAPKPARAPNTLRPDSAEAEPLPRGTPESEPAERRFAPDEPGAEEALPDDVDFYPLPLPYDEHVWLDVAFPLLWGRAMRTPPLVTTSPANTPQAQAGVLGLPTTQTLFGAESVLNEARPGGRIVLGAWLYHGLFGLEGDYLGLGEKSETFSRQSDGSLILAVPFFNADPAALAEQRLLVAFPGRASGSVWIGADSQFDSAGVRLLHDISPFCPGWHYCDAACGLSHWRWLLLTGYRFSGLHESLELRQNQTIAQGTFDIRDRFATENEFHGFDLGLRLSYVWRRVSLDVGGRMGLGQTHRTLSIAGSTLQTNNLGQTTATTGGLFAQPSNIGVYRDSRFTVLPECNVTLGCFLTDRLRATLGYTFVSWSHVLRPGEQIDRSVDARWFDAGALNGRVRPAPAFHETTMWLSGVQVGLDYRW